MLSKEPFPNRPERVTTNFSERQGKPINGFKLEGAALPDSPFVRQEHPVETGRPQPSDQAVKAALERQRSEVDL
jgi:hypothetical protein